jgi:hypothetical protein
MSGHTPKTDTSSKQQFGTPQKFKSPNSAIKDLTNQLDNMDSSMKSPRQDLLNTTINPQSATNSKKNQ